MVDTVSRRYWAFLSYSSKDASFAKQFHRQLESFNIPRGLVGKPGRDVPIPSRIFPIFRDRDELPLSSDLGSNIRDALEASRFLIVICSPNAAQSQWVNEEIRYFKSLGREDRILAVILSGEPNASEVSGAESLECFPPALRYTLDSNGHLTEFRTEPIAGDMRPNMDGRLSVLLKAVAGMTGLGFDELMRREQRRRSLRNTKLGALTILILFVVAFFAILARNARLNEVVANSEKEKANEVANRERSEKERAAYFSDMLEVGILWKRSEVSQARELLQKHTNDYKSMPFEWRYWNRVLNSKDVKRFRVANGTPSEICFGDDSKLLAVRLLEGSTTVLDPETGKELYRIPDPIHRISTSDLGWLGLSSEAEDGLNLYSYSDGTRKQTLMKITLGSAVAYDVANRKLAVGDIGGNIYTVQPWGAPLTRSGRTQGSPFGGDTIDDITTPQRRGFGRDPLHIQNAPVTGLAYSEDGKQLAVGFESGVGQVWDINDRPSPRTNFYDKKSGEVTGLAFDPSGKRIAMITAGVAPTLGETGTPARLYVWEINNSKFYSDALWSQTIHPVRERKLPIGFDLAKNMFPIPNPSPVFSLDGTKIYTPGDANVRVWDSTSGRELSPLLGHDAAVESVSIDSVNGRIAGASSTGDVLIWGSPDSVASKTIFESTLLTHSFALSDDERFMALSFESSDRMPNYGLGVIVVDLSTIKSTALAQRDFSIDPKTALSLSFRKNNYSFTYLDSGARNRGRDESLEEVATDVPVRLDADFYYFPSERRWKLTPVNDGKSGLTLELASGKKIELTSRAYTCFFCPEDGQRFVAGFQDGQVMMWADDGELLLDSSTGADPISAISMSDDGSMVAAGTMRREVLLFKTSGKDKEPQRLRGHRCEISGLQFNSDGSRLVSSSGLASVDGIQPGEVILWDVVTGKICLSLENSRPCRFLDVAFSPSGEKIYALSSPVLGETQAGKASIVVWDGSESQIEGKRP